MRWDPHYSGINPLHPTAVVAEELGLGIINRIDPTVFRIWMASSSEIMVMDLGRFHLCEQSHSPEGESLKRACS